MKAIYARKITDDANALEDKKQKGDKDVFDILITEAAEKGWDNIVLTRELSPQEKADFISDGFTVANWSNRNGGIVVSW